MLELTRSADIRDLDVGLTRVDSQKPSISLTRLLTNETWSRVSLHMNLWYRYCFSIASALVNFVFLLQNVTMWRTGIQFFSEFVRNFWISFFTLFRSGRRSSKGTYGPRHRPLVWCDCETSWLFISRWKLIVQSQCALDALGAASDAGANMAEVFIARIWTITSRKLCRFEMQAKLAWSRKYLNYTARFIYDKV